MWKRFFYYGFFRMIFGDNTLKGILIILAICIGAVILYKLVSALLPHPPSGKLDPENMTPIDEWFCSLVERIYGDSAIKWIRSYAEESHYAELMILKDRDILIVTIDELRSNRTNDGKVVDSEMQREIDAELQEKVGEDHRGSKPELVVEDGNSKIVFEIPKEDVNGDVLMKEIAWMRDFVRYKFQGRFEK